MNKFNLMGKYTTMVCLVSFGFLYAQRTSAGSWSPLEGRTRELLAGLACEYGERLHVTAQQQLLGVQYLSEKDTETRIQTLLKTRRTYAPLLTTGDVLFVANDYREHDDSQPILIFVAADASTLFRVVYKWGEEVRIVRRGTREYDRVLTIVRMRGMLVADFHLGDATVQVRPRTIRFGDELKRPLAGEFTLQERDTNGFLSAWFRNCPVDETGTIHLEDCPEVFNLYFTSKDGFYTSEYTEHDLPNSSSTNLVLMRPTGKLVFSVASYPKGQDVLIASCCLKTNSIYIQTADMCVHPEDAGRTLVFFGLAAGTYKVQLKSADTNQDYVVESHDIDVHVKRETTLGFEVPLFNRTNIPSAPDQCPSGDGKR